MNKNCIVVYASCGEGHKKAAEAVVEHFKFSSYDILHFSHRIIRELYSSGYRFIVKHLPFLWYGIFLLTELRIVKLLLDKLNLIIFLPFYNFLRKNKPHYVILTHFFPISIVKAIKRKDDVKMIVIITDMGVHPLWVDDSVDYYFVPIEYTKKELLKRNVPEEKIMVTGIPLREGFRKKIDPQDIRSKLGLEKEKTLLLLSSTTGNIHFLKDVLEQLSTSFNCIVIYGRNKKAESIIKRMKMSCVKGFPYYSRIWELMEIASFIITKPGGLTVFEALYKGKYLIFTHFIKGQEGVNKDIIEKLGKGVYVHSFDELKRVVASGEKVLYGQWAINGDDIFNQMRKILYNDEEGDNSKSSI